MIDRTGVEWIRPADAVERLNIHPSTIKQWVRKGVVRVERAGRYIALYWPDVLDAELAWRQRNGGHRRVRHAGDDNRPDME